LKKLFFLAALALLPVGATTIYSNLSDGNNGSLPVEGNQFWANEFESGSTAANLSDVIFNLEASTGTGALTVELFTNSNNAPNTLVATIGTISHATLTAGAFAQVTVTPGTTIALAANTQYWIELIGASISTADALWEVGPNDNGTGVAPEFHDRVTAGSVDATEANNSFSSTIPQMQVDVQSTVPEPATFGFLGIALAGLAAIRRRG
jgi:PEP-CTERM motif